MAEPTLSAHAQREIERIALEFLDIETFTIRNRDSLDFLEVYVGSVQDALKAAYLAGMVSHHFPQS